MNLQLHRPNRKAALLRFAIAITILNIAGHWILGFEQSWSQAVIGLLAAYGTEILLELIGSLEAGQRPRFLGSLSRFVEFLLPAHITGLATSMLLYTNERVWPTAFAAVVAIGSKHLIRIDTEQGTRHVFNPSNFGITVTLLAFPWIGIAPPYQYTENLFSIGDWVLPALIIASGSILNVKFTGKLPLLLGWIAGFAAQALFRAMLMKTPVYATLLPMTGVAFILFTFYMVTDPATTPNDAKSQATFGVAVAIAYGILVLNHIVFGLFFALTLVSAGRALLSFVPLFERPHVRSPLAPSAAGD